jgi:hypothetical protein
MKERRCLKFEAYIYMPDEKDDITPRDRRNFLSWLGMGRMNIYDEKGNKPKDKAIAFGNLGEMLNKICIEYSKRVRKRIPPPTKRKTK